MKQLKKVEIASFEESPLLHDKDAVLNEKFSSGLADHSLPREIRQYIQENPGLPFASQQDKVLSWDSPPPSPTATM